MDTNAAMKSMGGVSFVVLGPFLVADFSTNAKAFKQLSLGEHGMESVGLGQVTESHDHDFPSLYKSEGLDVESQGQRVSLPERAVTLVLPGVEHSWLPKRAKGAVGSIDIRHQKQVIAMAN